jgi:hypothetical protein
MLEANECVFSDSFVRTRICGIIPFQEHKICPNNFSCSEEIIRDLISTNGAFDNCTN